jgi:thiosulfate/3-mercaptopyruvate sulfurtransferase
MPDQADPIVTTAWLASQIGQSDLKIVDAPFYLPGDPRTPEGVYREVHIPGAVLFDLDQIADRSTDLPHMLAAPDAFAKAVGDLGIGDGDRVVVYDHVGLMSAARVWWNFRVMGLDRVHVLDGGLPRWIAEQRPVAVGAEPAPPPQRFVPRVRPQLVRSFAEVTHALSAGGQVLDARPAGRFSGRDPEPRPGLPSGHMPGALSLPLSDLVKDGALLPAEALEQVLNDAGADAARPTIATCGSGVTAAVIVLALARLGRWDAAVYDGAWTEWASRPDAAIARG